MSIEKKMNTRIQHKHDTEANWNKALNFIPKIGEIIVYDIDENYNYSRFKIGDGVRTINNLEFSQTDLTGYATESYVNEGLATKQPIGDYALKSDIPDVSSAIIDVIELPTENIKEDVYYRKLTVSLVRDREIQSTHTCHCVESLPEIGLPTTNLDQTEGHVYYVVGDGEPYCYVDDMLSIAFNIPAGWYPAAILLGALGLGYSGTITNIMNDPKDGNFRLLLEYVIYSYKDSWTSHKPIGWTGTGHFSEIFNNSMNVASGSYSHAEGYSTTASGNSSHAEGYGNNKAFDFITEESTDEEIIAAWKDNKFILASGDYSHAEGHNTLALYSSSHAEGQNTIASGYISHAEGQNTIASGSSSHAEGSITTASGSSSHAEGNDTIASGYTSHAEGWRTTASGNNSHAEGWCTTASGVGSHAEGSGNNKAFDFITEDSTDEEIIAAWEDNKFILANGNYSHAEGLNTLALGHSSHAEGYWTTASGGCSHAEGCGATASGGFSHAEGHSTTASGEYSHAEGLGTIAAGNYSHVQGQYNIENTGNLYAHIVGNGSSDSARSNAHTLDWEGNAWFAGDVYVGGTGQYGSAAVKLAKMNDIPSIKGLATESYVNTRVANLVNTAPEALNTLNELASALGDDPNFAATVTTEIGKKVDKVDGKGLSTNDFTDEYKDKLDQYNPPIVTQAEPPTDTSVIWVDTDDNTVDEFQDAVNLALAQAKVSGEFTPVKGIDYFTMTDKEEMISAVIAALPDVSEVSY